MDSSKTSPNLENRVDELEIKVQEMDSAMEHHADVHDEEMRFKTDATQCLQTFGSYMKTTNETIRYHQKTMQTFLFMSIGFIIGIGINLYWCKQNYDYIKDLHKALQESVSLQHKQNEVIGNIFGRQYRTDEAVKILKDCKEENLIDCLP